MIPRLELSGAHLLAKLLELVRLTLELPIESIYTWTDSTIVVSWLDGSPRRFNTYVGNQVSFIVSHLINGGTCLVNQTPQIVFPEVCYLWSLLIIHFGGMDLHGSRTLLSTGLVKQ